MNTEGKIYAAIAVMSVSAGFAFNNWVLVLTFAGGGFILGYLVEAMVLAILESRK